MLWGATEAYADARAGFPSGQGAGDVLDLFLKNIYGTSEGVCVLEVRAYST